MTCMSIRFAAFAVACLVASSVDAQAPEPQADVILQVQAPPPPADPAPQLPDPPDSRSRSRRPVLRVGGDYRLAAGDAVREVVAIYGDVVIDGRVDRDVVVVLGRAQLSSTADVHGSLVVVGGRGTVSPGARVARDLVVVASAFDAPAEFSPGGESIVVGSKVFGGAMEAVVPWLTRGLLWGRLIVPDLPWVWALAAAFFLLYLVVNLALARPVRACAETLVERPLTSFGAGILVMLLTGPVSVLLGVSIVGIVIIPFVYAAILAAWLVGKVAVARWIGMSIVPEESADNRLHATRSFAIGFAVICLAYAIPVIGLVVWATVGVLGLGAATLAFLAAYRRENPPTVGAVPTAPAPPLSQSAGGAASASAPATSIAFQQEGAAMSSSEGPDLVFTQPIAPPDPAAGSAATAAAIVLPSDLTSLPRASLGDRAAAGVLDLILVVIALQLLGPVFLPFRDEDFRSFLFLLLAYHVGFWASKGTTVGGIIVQLRVVRIDSAPLRFSDALVRGLGAIFSVAVLGLGFFWILRDQEQQAWHDKIAGTYVVKVPRSYPR